MIGEDVSFQGMQKEAGKLHHHHHFDYCSSVWHFFGTRNTDKLEALNKRILRFILGDYLSPYDSLLTRVSTNSLYNKRVQNFLLLLYEPFFHSFSCLYERYVFTSFLFL